MSQSLTNIEKLLSDKKSVEIRRDDALIINAPFFIQLFSIFGLSSNLEAFDVP